MARTKNVDALVERECCICGRVFLPAVLHLSVLLKAASTDRGGKGRREGREKVRE